MPSDRTAATAAQGELGDDAESRSARKGGNPLQRGSACLSCRKRKMKCDATKPVCRQCVKANRAEECDYDDGRQKSRTQILQEKIAKLEERIKELETAEDEGPGTSEQQAYDAFGQQSTQSHAGGPSSTSSSILGEGFNYASGSGSNGTDGGFAGGYSHSPAGSGSGSSSSPSGNGHSQQSFSPLILDAGNPAISSYSSGATGVPQAGPGPSSGLSMQHHHPHHQQQQQQQSAFYPPPDIPGAAELFGLPTSPNGSAHSGSAAEHGPGNHGSSSVWTPQNQQHEQQIMNSMFGAVSSGSTSMGAGFNLSMNMGLPGMEMNYDPSLVMGMNMNLSAPAMNLDSGNAQLGMNMGMQMPTDPSLSMPGYSAHGISAFSGSPASAPFHNATVPSMRPPSSSIPSWANMQGLNPGAIPGPGANSLSVPPGRPMSAAQSASASKGKKPMSRWDADVLPAQERKILVDIFLPHARQCGMDLSPERLYQRLELDSAYPNLFPRPAAPAQADVRPPPAHAALANAIFLLACHFSSVHIPGSTPAFYMGASGNGKQTDLSSHEQQFLTRALRGIAAALEAGEAAASDSASSRSSRSSRSGRGSTSPRSSAASASGSPASGFQSRPVSRPSTSTGNGKSTSGGSNSSSSASAVASGSGVTTGLGGGVRDEPEPDPATPLVDAVQASALLAVYFFSKARLLEGYYHASAAARLAVSLGMHQVRSAVWRPPTPSPPLGSSGFGASPPESAYGSDSSGFSRSDDPNAGSWSGSPTPSPAVLLPPARSAYEHAERVSLFWHVFFIDRCWSVATGLPSSLPDDEHPQLKISTVWPWDVEPGKEITRENADYESLGSLFDVNANATRAGATKKNRCTKALKAKAAAFFERAARIASMQSEPTHWEQLTQLEFALNKFIAELPPYTVPASSSPTTQLLHIPHTPQNPNQPDQIDVELALVHTLSHAAVIQLHHPRAQKDMDSHSICVRAAAACAQIIRRVPARDYVLLDPVIGTCWMCVSDVLLRERMWGGNMASARDPRMAAQEYFGVEAELDVVVGALKQLSYVFPVALYQVQKVEQSRNATTY